MTDSTSDRGRFGWHLYALSFAALFLELMLIRWVPAVVRLVAYYANLMLISSFLGLGIGAMLARWRFKRFNLLPAFVVLPMGLWLGCECASLVPPVDPREARFEYVPTTPTQNYTI